MSIKLEDLLKSLHYDPKTGNFTWRKEPHAAKDSYGDYARTAL